jgi:hypothetical protein
MSKYSGSITIFNDQGESAFERELTQDEIVDTILAHAFIRAGTAPSGVDVPKEVVKVARKTVGSVLGDKPKSGRFTTKECCGSTGTRHFKWCKEMGGIGININGPVVKNGIVDDFTPKRSGSGKMRFSRSSYDTIKTMSSQGMTADGISSEKGFDLDDVMCIRKSISYEEYVNG